MINIGINGFGRIGRNFLRCWHLRGDGSPLEVVAINDSGGVKQAAHLLKYDSVPRTWQGKVSGSGTVLDVDGQKIATFAET